MGVNNEASCGKKSLNFNCKACEFHTAQVLFRSELFNDNFESLEDVIVWLRENTCFGEYNNE